MHTTHSISWLSTACTDLHQTHTSRVAGTRPRLPDSWPAHSCMAPIPTHPCISPLHARPALQIQRRQLTACSTWHLQGGRCPVQNLPPPPVRASLRVKTEHGLGAALGYLTPDGAPIMARIPPFVRRAPPSQIPPSVATHSRSKSDFSFGGGMGNNTLTSSDIGPGTACQEGSGYAAHDE